MNKRIVKLMSVLWLTLVSTLSFAQNRVTVSGVVSDQSGQPVIGASVVAQGSTTGVPTDLDGKYSITVPSDAILEFSSVGMASQSIPVNGRGVINVVLAEDNTFLESVVVVGYGTQKPVRGPSLWRSSVAP